MKRAALSLLLLAALSGAAQAHDKHVSCDVHSNYDLRLHGKAFVFTRDDGPAQHVAIGGGRLFVDGKEVTLSLEDRARVRRYESELNRLVPEAQHVVREATDIAFTALIEVARGFSQDGSNQQSLARLETARKQVHADLAAHPPILFDEDVGERVIKPLLAEYIPVIAGNAVSSTLAVAFSGDEKKADEFERRMDRMGDEIERKVEHRAEALEPMVERMCERTRELDRLEKGLAVRVDGEPLDLLRSSSSR
jgi:hypothetical protein